MPPDIIMADMLAAMFARECNLPHGNLWEPVIARKIRRDLNTDTPAAVEAAWRRRLGLERP